jgi:iduronate 2-sulfatase
MRVHDKKDRYPHFAITTYGRNNHAVRDENFRYIRYEDSSEKLYDHSDDENEGHNVTDKNELSNNIV